MQTLPLSIIFAYFQGKILKHKAFFNEDIKTSATLSCCVLIVAACVIFKVLEKMIEVSRNP